MSGQPSNYAANGLLDCFAKVFHVAGFKHLFTYNLPAPIVCATWRPDDSAFALGLDNCEWQIRSRRTEEEKVVDEASKSVSLWLRSTLREWETELTARQAGEKDRRVFAEERGQYRQSKQYLRPLRKALRDGSISPGIVTSLSCIAEACQKRLYKEAKEAYMKLAIGTQPWPIGVTTVTFHDRPNRHNIGEDNVAHILNDETTRKYVQMIKRLVTYTEKRWPIDPSRAA